MSADDVIRKLALIEKEPRKVWNAICQYYGDGFFTEIIEEEYCLNSEANRELREIM